METPLKATMLMKKQGLRRWGEGNTTGPANHQVVEKMGVSRIAVWGEGLGKKDVKNEGWSDYLHENTFEKDKMSCRLHACFAIESSDCTVNWTPKPPAGASANMVESRSEQHAWDGTCVLGASLHAVDANLPFFGLLDRNGARAATCSFHLRGHLPLF